MENENPKLKNDWWDDLSESQRQSINEGIKDVEEGRVISSEKFWEIVKKADILKH